MDKEQTEIHYFRQFNPLDTSFYLKIIETSFHVHIWPSLPILGQDWSKIDQKWPKHTIRYVEQIKTIF